MSDIAKQPSLDDPEALAAFEREREAAAAAELARQQEAAFKAKRKALKNERPTYTSDGLIDARPRRLREKSA